MSDSEEWNREDVTWQLLGKAEPRKASARFADDTLRAVRLLPEADPWWPKILRFSPWMAAAACVLFAATVVFESFDASDKPLARAGNSSVEDQSWSEIEAKAEEELLAAAADHLDRFSDQELVSLMGF